LTFYIINFKLLYSANVSQ